MDWRGVHLPTYIVGMIFAEHATKDTFWIRRMRTLTIGFLTPFYFLRAGTSVSLPALVSAPEKLMKIVPQENGLSEAG